MRKNYPILRGLLFIYKNWQDPQVLKYALFYFLTLICSTVLFLGLINYSFIELINYSFIELIKYLVDPSASQIKELFFQTNFFMLTVLTVIILAIFIFFFSSF
ncbi:MAG: hypothetical protein ACK4J0_04090 [Candidatus Anstonellaceae archaeon]